MTSDIVSTASWLFVVASLYKLHANFFLLFQKPFNLDDYESAKALEKLGLDGLKSALTERGLKCGGTLEQRAQRLFSIKSLSVHQIDKSLFAKASGKK